MLQGCSGRSQQFRSTITCREARIIAPAFGLLSSDCLLTHHVLAGQVLDRRWFANRRCLDIGCNEGLVTLAVATRFGAASMLGVDLDEHLIRNACRQAPLHHASWRSQASVPPS